MNAKAAEEVASAIRDSLSSPNVCDQNGETANIVDALASIARAGFCLSNSIVPRGVSPGHDSRGGHIASLTEAVMSVGRSLDGIAEALNAIAEAIQEKH